MIKVCFIISLLFSLLSPVFSYAADGDFKSFLEQNSDTFKQPSAPMKLFIKHAEKAVNSFLNAQELYAVYTESNDLNVTEEYRNDLLKLIEVDTQKFLENISIITAMYTNYDKKLQPEIVRLIIQFLSARLKKYQLHQNNVFLDGLAYRTLEKNNFPNTFEPIKEKNSTFLLKVANLFSKPNLKQIGMFQALAATIAYLGEIVSYDSSVLFNYSLGAGISIQLFVFYLVKTFISNNIDLDNQKQPKYMVQRTKKLILDMLIQLKEYNQTLCKHSSKPS